MKADEIKKYDKEIISGGLIPKMRYFDFAFSVPVGGTQLKRLQLSDDHMTLTTSLPRSPAPQTRLTLLSCPQMMS